MGWDRIETMEPPDRVKEGIKMSLSLSKECVTISWYRMSKMAIQRSQQSARYKHGVRIRGTKDFKQKGHRKASSDALLAINKKGYKAKKKADTNLKPSPPAPQPSRFS